MYPEAFFLNLFKQEIAAKQFVQEAAEIFL